MPSRQFGAGGMIERSNSAREPGASVAVGNTSTLVASEVPLGAGERIFANDSDEVMYLRLAATGAQLNKGPRLNANGGSLVLQSYTGPVCAICATGGKNLTVTEV